MITLPRVITRESQSYVAIRKLVAMKEIEPAMQEAFGKLTTWIEGERVTPAGPPFVKYNVIDMENLLELEFCFPFDRVPADIGDFQLGQLVAGEYAHIGLRGHFKHLVDVNAMLIGWARFKSLDLDMKETTAGDAFAARFEVYKTDPEKEPDPRKWESEVFIKIRDR